MNDETTRQRIRADKAEAELVSLKNAVRHMLDWDRPGDKNNYKYFEAKDLVKRMIK